MRKHCRLAFLIFLIILLFNYKDAVAQSGDAIPPSTTASLDPSSPDGNNGWYVSPISVTLTSTDLESGVKSINWRLNSGVWNQQNFDNTLNLIINPSFEADTNGWEFVPHPNSSGGRTLESAAAGNASVKISSSENGIADWNNRGSYVVATAWENISVRVWLKGSSVLGNGAYYNVYAITDTGDVLLYTSPSHSGTFDWLSESKDLVVNADGAYGVYLELVLDGVGTAYFDAVYVSKAPINPEVNFDVSGNGNNILEYYAEDFAGNTELIKSVSFKMDLSPPKNWQNFSAVEAGNDHTLISSIDVEDSISGLDPSTAMFEYSVLGPFVWGHFPDPQICAGMFVFNDWLDLNTNFSEGASSGRVETPPVDFCNSNWLVCKGLRFRINDVAGNESVKTMCLNGPWMQVGNEGDVGAMGGIEMIASSPEPNTDGLIVSSKGVSNFSSSKGWELADYDNKISLGNLNYLALIEKYPPQDTVAKLPVEDGIFKTEGDLRIRSSTIPSDYEGKIFKNVLFVNGDLVIDRDYRMNEISSTVFVVKGDVRVHRRVEEIHGYFIASGTFDSGYSGLFFIRQLKVYGGVLAEKFYLPRFLLAANNQKTPAELFIYEPKYLINLAGLFGSARIYWKEIQ